MCEGGTPFCVSFFGEPAVNTYTFGPETFAIFEHWNKGNVWMLHFIWGKKDFRLYLEKTAWREENAPGTVLLTKDGMVVVNRLQYLYNFNWYDYDGVSGHGMTREDTRWRRGPETRYMELPREFYSHAVELACLEFELEREKE